VVVKVPHTAKTIVNHVAELRTCVRALDEDDQERFFSLSIARPDLCTKDHGGKLILNSFLKDNLKIIIFYAGDTRMMGIFHTNAIALKQLDKMKAKDLGKAIPSGYFQKLKKKYFVLFFVFCRNPDYKNNRHKQCCGSGMFYLGSHTRIREIFHPGSQIQDPKSYVKRGIAKVNPLFSCCLQFQEYR
jgi:hypothetical protein